MNLTPPHHILTYIKDRKDQRVGCFLALKDDEGLVGIGWSLCNHKDRFDRDRALDIAEGRAYAAIRRPSPIPHSMRPHLDDFVSRARKYFKTEDVRF